MAGGRQSAPWRPAAVLAIVALALPSFASAQVITRRFGGLVITGGAELHYRGHPLRPPIAGNDTLTVRAHRRLPASDIVLLESGGGTDCPAQYFFVRVSTVGVSASPAFGTCTDLIAVRPTAAGLAVSMPGFVVAPAGVRARRRAARARHSYALDGDVFATDGTRHRLRVQR